MNNFFNRLIYGKSNKADYTKEALENESKTKLFFDILGVKYSQLITLNLLIVVFMIPAFVWTWLTFSVIATESTSQIQLSQYMIFYTLGLIPCLLILAVPLAGITYIIKNFTQDKHVWLWKDFVSHAKSNAKQALLYMLTYGVMLLVGQTILFFYNSILSAGNFILVLRSIFFVFFVLLSLSVMYAFPLIVTYKLKLKHIIKNSLLLTVGSLHTTFLAPICALLPFALLILLSFIWNYGLIFLIAYALLFGFAFAMYVTISFTTSVFAKHLNPDADKAADQNSDKI